MSVTAIAWRTARRTPSLPEVHRTVPVDRRAPARRRFLAFAGPGFLVAIGYMDPGNWATGLAAGSRFGYSLLWVILLSNAMALVLQALAARLGIATGRDLAQACHDSYTRPARIVLWLLCELSICATDLAEVIGTAVAFELLLGIPIAGGVCLTAVDVFFVLWLQRRGFRYLEATTIALIAVVVTCFAIELAFARPHGAAIAAGLVPGARTFTEPDRLYIAIGIIGATVMPHNLYLHSSIVQTRRYGLDPAGRRDAAALATADVIVALSIAALVNASIVILAASVFGASGHHDVVELHDAYRLLSPLLSASGAGLVFGIALLASGKSSTMTATLTGQIVMEGFLFLRVRPWVRRLVTRALAIVPALIVVTVAGEHGLGRLLILSQAVLSLQLPFAVFPLLQMTSSRAKMGELVSPGWLRASAWVAAITIVALNGILLGQLIM